MQQLIQCQIARSIHYTTSAIIVRLPEQPSAKFTRTAWWSVCTLIFFISDKVHVYSGEGRKTEAQHVMNDIDQPTMLEYILASVRARLCVLAPRLSQGMAGWPFCRQLRPVCSHFGPHVSDIPRGSALTDWPYTYFVLHLSTTPSFVIVYRARFIMLHFSECISTTRETLDAYGQSVNAPPLGISLTCGVRV